MLIDLEDNFDYISENLKIIRERVGEVLDRCGEPERKVRIMAVTKTVPPEKVNFAVSQGIDLIGENKVQEYTSKREFYDKSAEVHFIGHLQTNKVKYIVDSVSMIQSVDRFVLAEGINRKSSFRNKTMDILCEVNIGGEDSKSGVLPENLKSLIEEISGLENLRIRGLMTIPPRSDSDIFLGKMQELFLKTKQDFPKLQNFDTLSMGMTGDYVQAVKYGSTLVRIGTGLFGERAYR